ncbi:MAG: hypothetical protein D6785_07655 [Planctomycetota bacterium]|nr:MAG: hypothetical protein D6785_07655 [Planctomycetota bacterium]
MEAKVKSTSKLYLRKINIVKWNTPVCRQYGIRSIPHLMLYNPKGKLLSRGLGNVMNQIMKIQ